MSLTFCCCTEMSSDDYIIYGIEQHVPTYYRANIICDDNLILIVKLLEWGVVQRRTSIERSINLQHSDLFCAGISSQRCTGWNCRSTLQYISQQPAMIDHYFNLLYKFPWLINLCVGLEYTYNRKNSFLQVLSAIVVHNIVKIPLM